MKPHGANVIVYTEAGHDAGLSRSGEVEFKICFECGNLTHGFLRLRAGRAG